ncbi:hypothetical protein IE077_000044 [Cardiosporidium cionae]|uniref:BRCT domain-containing protein n=1 Tax=Cardiosporidium cionae TaxID=476202 RepID=A0ABQ7J6C4_9APIC|nr:hypothetical protein IE077_000044 [Cardiosporidium cionae]|eukprot:KAF8819510.1 hypothetical protein IE077_000044 [Cardiosporidium cionae]
MKMNPFEHYYAEKDDKAVRHCPSISNTLWGGRTFCFIGFDELEDSSMHELVGCLLVDVIENGGSFILEASLSDPSSLPTKDINFFVCNYAKGYSTRPYNAIDRKTVTPLWLIFCHKDQRIYSPQYQPFFQPNACFNAAFPSFCHLRILFLGLKKKRIKVHELTDPKNVHAGSARYCDDIEIILRFIILSGSQWIPLQDVQSKEKGISFSNVTHVVISEGSYKASLTLIQQAIRENIPVLSLNWLYHSYREGHPLPEKHYAMHLTAEGQLSIMHAITLSKKSPGEEEKTQRALILYRMTLYMSHYLVSKQPQLIAQCEKMGSILEKTLFIVHPLSFLLPWIDSQSTLKATTTLRTPAEIDVALPPSISPTTCILLLHDDEINAGFFDAVAVHVEELCESCEINTLPRGKHKKDHLHDVSVALPRWIDICWKRCSFVPLSTDTGGVQIPSYLLHGYFDPSVYRDTTHGKRKKRKSGYTLHDLAESVIYGGDELDASNALERKHGYFLRQTKAAEYKNLISHCSPLSRQENTCIHN